MSFGGHTMVGPLRRVLVQSPRAAGWTAPERHTAWPMLGFLHAPDFASAQREHDALVDVLHGAGVELVELAAFSAGSLDSVYVHDASLVTDAGAICLRMGKAARQSEPPWHAALYQSLGIPLLGVIEAPGTAEAGDMVWLDASTLLVGRGYRTNAAGISQLRQLLQPLGVAVLEASLPHGRGREVCLHLMSILSLLDERHALVDLPWLAVSTVELLQDRGFELVEIEPTERETLACNVLSLGEKRLVIFAENPRTSARLRDAGFTVHAVGGREIGINGGGGPTCLTRPLWRS